MGFFSWNRSSKFEDDPQVDKLANANVCNIRVALGIVEQNELIDDVSDLISQPIAIGYIFGAMIKSYADVLSRYGDEGSERFTSYVLQHVFTQSATARLKSRAMELYRSEEHAKQMREGANLAIRDIQSLVSNWARGIPPSATTAGYKISWRNPD